MFLDESDDSVHDYHGDCKSVRKEMVIFLQHELELISKNFAFLIKVHNRKTSPRSFSKKFPRLVKWRR